MTFEGALKDDRGGPLDIPCAFQPPRRLGGEATCAARPPRGALPSGKYRRAADYQYTFSNSGSAGRRIRPVADRDPARSNPIHRPSQAGESPNQTRFWRTVVPWGRYPNVPLLSSQRVYAEDAVGVDRRIHERLGPDVRRFDTLPEPHNFDGWRHGLFPRAQVGACRDGGDGVNGEDVTPLSAYPQVCHTSCKGLRPRGRSSRRPVQCQSTGSNA